MSVILIIQVNNLQAWTSELDITLPLLYKNLIACFIIYNEINSTVYKGITTGLVLDENTLKRRGQVTAL